MPEKSGKSIAQRIRLDYHKDRGWLYWSRWLCSLIALAVSGMYGLAVLAGAFSESAPGLSPATHLSTGRLAEVHSHFQNDCQACHSSLAWVPIAHDAFKPDAQLSLTQLNSACQKCHSVASHVANLPASSACRSIDGNCSNCHQDHRGTDIDLAKVATPRCTACHRDLAGSCGASGGVRLVNAIEDFSLASHREFDSLNEDKGRIKFDHSQHLLLGQVEEGSLGKFKISMLNAEWRRKYQVAGAEGHIQLTCRDCHLLNSPAGLGDYTQPDRFKAAGSLELSSHYEPIDYEQHCAACHELTYAGQAEEDLPLPHAATREELEVLLAARLTGGQVTGRIRTRSQSSDFDTPGRGANLNLTSRVDEVVANCTKCHQAADVTSAAILERRSQKFSEPLIPSVWLKRGLYNHGAHEKITNCEFCHDVVGLSADLRPTDNEQVMIKGAETCVPCHRDPAYRPEDPLVRSWISDLATDAGQADLLGTAGQPVQASDECTLCHRYHWSRPIEQNGHTSDASEMPDASLGAAE